MPDQLINRYVVEWLKRDALKYEEETYQDLETAEDRQRELVEQGFAVQLYREYHALVKEPIRWIQGKNATNDSQGTDDQSDF